MKRSSPYFAFIILGLIAALFIFKSRQDQPEGDQAGNPDTLGKLETPTGKPSPTPGNDSPGNGSADPSTHDAKPAKPRDFSPLPENLHSSLVTAELKEGETLVMGGYRKPNGSHEFILVTPRKVTLEGYEGMIQLQARIFSLDPEHLEQSGLAGLATDKRNADGKSEIWKLEERKDSLQHAGQLINPPIVSVKPGEPASVNYGMENGGQGFNIEYTATLNPDGSFSLQALTERNPGGNH